MLKVREFGDVTDFHMGRSIGPFVPYAVHAFLVKDILIDTGTRYASSEFLQALKGRSVSAIINTHHHEDHIGNNRFLQDTFGSAVYAHELALPFLADPRTIGLKLYQRFVWGVPVCSEGSALDDQISCSGLTFQIIHTPGHSPDHVCVYEPETGHLFTGDLFCGRVVRYLRRDEDFMQILSSLKRLVRRDISTVFCGLKGIVENGHAALSSKAAFMEDLVQQVSDLRKKGLSSREIRRRMLGYEDAMFYLSTAHFSKQHVVESILAGK